MSMMSASEAQSITGLVARIVKPKNGSTLSPYLQDLANGVRFQLVSKVESSHVPDPRYPSGDRHSIEHRVETVVAAGPDFESCVAQFHAKLRRNGGAA